MDPGSSGSGSTHQKSGNSKSTDTICPSVRLQRNQAEKQRRDRLNGYISELAEIVPMVRNSSKPVDKVSVLRLAAAHMRLNFSCLNPKNFNSNIPALPVAIQSYLEIVEKNIGGFILVTTLTGVVLFCSRCIEDFVGYQSIDLIGQPIYNYLPAKEVSFFKKKVNTAISGTKKEKKTPKVVKLHMQQRPLPRSTEVKYRKMLFKLSVHHNDSFAESTWSKTKSTQKIKKGKQKDFGGSSVVLMFVEPMKMEPKINRAYLLTHQDIYFTIHGLQGEIMYADQRIATITGYMPRDVQGTSAYQYILDNDVPIALFAQKAMFSSNDGTGLITYRLKIFDATYIYLQSKGQIVFKDNSTEISHFMCYNRKLSDAEGSKELKKFQERFAPQIPEEKAIEEIDGNPNAQPFETMQNADTGTVQCFQTSKDCMESTSGYAMSYYEVFGQNNHATVKNANYMQTPSGSTAFEESFVLQDNVSKNYSSKSSFSKLNGSTKTFAYSSDEFGQVTATKEMINCSVPSVENNASFTPTASSNDFDFEGIANASSILNGKQNFQGALLQSQDSRQAHSAYELGLDKIASIESGLSVQPGNHCVDWGSNCMELSELTPVTPRLSAGSDFLPVSQLYSSAIDGFGFDKEVSPNIMDANVTEQINLKSNTAFKVSMNEQCSSYPKELRSDNFAMPKYESNGHYNMHSTYASPKMYHQFQNFPSNGFEGDAYSGANLQLNGANVHMVAPNCYAGLSTFKTTSSKRNGPASQNEYNMRMCTSSKEPHNHTRAFNVPNGILPPMSGISHSGLQKQNVSKNKYTAIANDAYNNPYGIPAKRIRTDEVLGNSDVIYNYLNDCSCGLYPDMNVTNGASNLSQNIKKSSYIRVLHPPPKDTESATPFGGDLYDELDMFLKQMPLSTCTTQSQLS